MGKTLLPVLLYLGVLARRVSLYWFGGQATDRCYIGNFSSVGCGKLVSQPGCSFPCVGLRVNPDVAVGFAVCAGDDQMAERSWHGTARPRVTEAKDGRGMLAIDKTLMGE